MNKKELLKERNKNIVKLIVGLILITSSMIGIIYFLFQLKFLVPIVLIFPLIIGIVLSLDPKKPIYSTRDIETILKNEEEFKKVR